MAKQQILYPIRGKHTGASGIDNENSILENQAVIGYKVKLPKIITDISTFEMQFGMKAPVLHSNKQHTGIESMRLPSRAEGGYGRG
jgi:hypothetical protein